MSKISDMMKNLTDLQGAMDTMSSAMQEKMKDIQAEGSAGAGMVRIVLCGDFTVQEVFIDESLFKDGGVVIGDLVKVATNEALQKLQQAMKDNISTGLPLPDGFKMPF